MCQSHVLVYSVKVPVTFFLSFPIAAEAKIEEQQNDSDAIEKKV